MIREIKAHFAEAIGPTLFRLTIFVMVMGIGAACLTGCNNAPKNRTITGIVSKVEFLNEFGHCAVTFQDGRVILLDINRYRPDIFVLNKTNEIVYKGDSNKILGINILRGALIYEKPEPIELGIELGGDP